MIRKYVLPIALPVIVIGGFVLAGGSNGFFSDAWEEFLGPFLITYWIGLGFTNAWDLLKDSMHGVSPTVIAVTGALSALLILGMLGGPAILIEDPWLFGVAVAPGLQLALPWWRKRKAVESLE
jgi:hypothetical protein